MRPTVACVLVMSGILSQAAVADRADYQVAPPPPENKDFWGEIVDPHGAEVQQVLAKINQVFDLVNQLATNDSDPDGTQRARLLADARGMARYLRRLAPANPEVLLALGKVADEAGRADEALEALEAYLELTPDGGEAAFRVGRIYLRMRAYDDAIRYLRIGQATAGWLTNASIYLASALAASGRDDDAIAELESAVNSGRTGWGGEPQLPSFALAVAYDRDEQINEAFEVLDRLQTNLQGGFLTEMQRQLDGLSLAPPGEAHYYRALLYESNGFLDEARTSWLLYANDGEVGRYRARALQHVAAIDKLMQRAVAARRPGKHAGAAAGGVIGGVILPPPASQPRRRHPRRPSP